MKKLFVVLALILPMMAMAQKIGHVNSSEIMAAMPELTEAQKTLEASEAEYKKEMEAMQQELQDKYKAFQDKANLLGEAERNKQLLELQDLDGRIQKFAELSRQALTEQQAKLMQPIQEKVMKAIEAEAKAKGLSYVLDQQAMLYMGKDAVDITPGVKKALGLK